MPIFVNKVFIGTRARIKWNEWEIVIQVKGNILYLFKIWIFCLSLIISIDLDFKNNTLNVTYLDYWTFWHLLNFEACVNALPKS